MKDRFFRIYTFRSGEPGYRNPRPGSVIRVVLGLLLLTVFLFLILALGWIFLLAGIVVGIPWMLRAWWSRKAQRADGPNPQGGSWIDGQWRPLEPPTSLPRREEPDGRDGSP